MIVVYDGTAPGTERYVNGPGDPQGMSIDPVYDGTAKPAHERTMGPGHTVAFPDRAHKLLYGGFPVERCPRTNLAIPECHCTPCLERLRAEHEPRREAA